MSDAPRHELTYTFSHRPDIQGLRGVAVILVILYHAHVTATSGGYVGVDVFFVISGFVIAAGIFKELARRDGAFSFRGFYERRMRRLLPSLSVTVCLTMMLGLFLGPYSSLKQLRETGVAATLFHANQYLFGAVEYFGPTAERNALLHTWSLSVEEQFYFVFPLLFVLAAGFAIRRKKRVYRTVAGLMSVVFVCSLLVQLYFSYTDQVWFGWDMKRAAFFSAPLRAWEFGVGVLLATMLPWLQRRGSLLQQRALLGAGLSMVISSAVLYDGDTLFPGVAAMLPVLGTAAMIVAGSLRVEAPVPVVSHGLLTRVGDLSYGWYLWHWPPLVFVAATWPGDPFVPMLCTLLVSLALAWLNERLIEKPVRHATWIKERRWSSVAILVVCMALPLSSVWGQKLVLEQMAQNEEIAALDSMEREYRAIGCNSNPYLASQQDCRWGERDAPWRVVLIGDSNARQFIPVLREVVPELGGELHAATLDRCMFSDLRVVRYGTEYTRCTDWHRDTMVALEADPPDLVLITSSYDNYHSEKFWSFADSDSDRVFVERSQRIEATQHAIERATERLVAVGSKVAFIKPIPKFKGRAFFDRGEGDATVAFGANCSLVKLWFFPESCGAERELVQGDEPAWIDMNHGRQAYKTALGEHIEEIVVDEALCPDNRCAARQRGRWVYRDAGHLSPHGARQTRAIFETFLKHYSVVSTSLPLKRRRTEECCQGAKSR